MKSEAGVPVAYAMHDSPKRDALLPVAGFSVVAGLSTACDTAGNWSPVVAEAWSNSSIVQQPVAQIPRDARTCGVSVALDGVRATVGYGV